MDATTSRSLMNTGDESDGSTANGGYYSDSDDDESTSSETKTPNNEMLEPLRTFTTRGTWGVCQLDSRLYVVGGTTNNVVRVYDIDNNALNDTIRVDGLTDPRDIASCADTRRLYVADNGCIWRLNATDGTFERHISTDYSPFSLSVTSRRLLVTDNENTALHVYDEHGRSLLDVALPRTISPTHAIETDPGTFVVSHVGPRWRSDDCTHQVSQVDSDGRVAHSFGGKGSEQLKMPLHLAPVSDGRLLVADSGNSRVLLVDTRGGWTARVVMSDETRRPFRLSYDARGARLCTGFYAVDDIELYGVNLRD